jgi:glycosyltransferase involved in cell wall biosynthesis
MKCLFVIDHLGAGGAQRQMVSLAIELVKRGYIVDFLIYYPEYTHFEDHLLKYSINIYKVKKKDRIGLNIIWSIISRINNDQYDIILSFLYTPGIYTELASLRVKRKPPIIVSMRSVYPNGQISITKYILEQFHRLASCVTVNTEYQRLLMLEVHPWLGNKITTIYNGVDLNLFKPSTENLFSDNEDTVKILVVSNTRRMKNMLGIANAIVEYQFQYGNPPIIHWAGRISCTPDDKQALDKSFRILKQHNLEGKMKLLGPKKNINLLYHKYDAVLLASFYEGLPNVICEAFACGKPVLASNVCENGRIITPGHTGFLFNPHNAGDIAYTLNRYSKLDYSIRLTMGNNARKYAEAHFDINEYVTNYQKLFHSML